MNSLPGFDPPVPLPEGRTARLTERNRRKIARGMHPLGAPLANHDGTCGNCAFAQRTWTGNRYLKCSQFRTNSAETDVRAKWPACVAWRPR